jgi:hypothetical protein
MDSASLSRQHRAGASWRRNGVDFSYSSHEIWGRILRERAAGDLNDAVQKATNTYQFQ